MRASDAHGQARLECREDNMPPIVDLNGKLVRADSAEVTVSDLGVLYGIGLFETMRS